MSEKADPVVCGCGAAATTNNRSTFLRIAVEHLAGGRRSMKPYLWGGVAIGVLAGVVGPLLRPSPVRHGRVLAVRGHTPAYASISWRYGMGLRPTSVIFDLEMDSGASGSVTTDGEAFEAEIPLPTTDPSAYRLRATASYRVLGIPHTKEFHFQGEAPLPESV
jgi:hypothetical protein